MAVAGVSSQSERSGARTAPAHRRRRSGALRPYFVLVVLFGVTRLIAAIAGVRFDMWPLGHDGFVYPYQLLDPRLLQHHLIVSIWHLNSQPPLYNLLVGLLLHLPVGLRQTVAAGLYLGLGLVMILSAFAAMTALRAPRWLAMLVCVLAMVDPTSILYENWLGYAYPTAAFLTLSAYFAVNYARTLDRWWGIGFFSSITVVTLFNSTYQLPWLMAAVLVIVLLFRSHWRSVLAVAAVPCLVLVGWMAKDFIQVGSPSTSTWLGMNFSYTTIGTDTPGDIQSLIKRHVLTPIAAVGPFSPVSSYVPKFVREAHTGVPATDEPSVADGSPNFNNQIYFQVSQLYFHDDLAWINANPRSYAVNVLNSMKLWMVPPDEYAFIKGNRARIAGWAETYDRTVRLRPSSSAGVVPLANQLSYTSAAVLGLAIVGAPILAWRRRRMNVPWAAAMGYLSVTTAYAFFITSFIEYGENERFAMELGLVPVIAAAAVVGELWRLWSARRELGRSA